MKEIFFDEIDSTNTYLKTRYNKYEDMMFVGTNLQTNGHGRNGRSWFSNKGENLMFSLLIKNEEVIKQYRALSVLSAYSVIEVLKEYKVEKLSFKWPNDVYVDGKKICGILLESVSSNSIECLIIGVGINVNQKEFDCEYLNEPVSLSNILDEHIDLDIFRKKIYERFVENINKLKNGYDFIKDIREYDYLKNKEVYVSINNEIKKVKVLGIDTDYTLKILQNDKEMNIDSGEVSFHI